jgi:hypothetical protein
MPIKTVQNSGLTATSIMNSSTHGVNTDPLTHQQLDENFNSIWPVGSVYINVASDANPRDLIGFGVWVSLGKQTILVGKNSNLAHTAGVDTTNQGLSSKISSVSVFSDLNNRKCDLIITTTAAHKFSKGQRVTLSGITGATGSVDPNREREITSIDSSTKFRVDYRSPAPAGSGTTIFSQGLDEPLGASNASATLFGTRYDEGERSGAEEIPFVGTGGKAGQKMSVGEFPTHNHTVNWSFVNTISVNRASGRGGSHASRIGSGNGIFRDPQWGFVDMTNRGRYGGEATTNDVGLALRGNGETYTVNGNPYQYYTAREAHSNLMPFIGAYFWVRIADPVEE